MTAVGLGEQASLRRSLEAEKAGLEKTFKLKSSLSTTNMVLFDADGKIAKCATQPDDSE